MSKRAMAAVGLPAAILIAVAVLRLSLGSSDAPEGTGDRPVPPVETRRIGENRWVVSRRDRDTYLQDLAEVGRQITLKPNPGQDTNSVTDLTILRLAEQSPMHAAGFRKHDRILKVNGTPIGTMGRAVNLVHEVKACSRLTVQVQRGDEIIDYQFDFE